MTTTYRAAYWISADRQADVRLTAEEHQALSDEDLRIEALRYAEDIELEIGDGSIEIGDYTE